MIQTTPRKVGRQLVGSHEVNLSQQVKVSSLYIKGQVATVEGPEAGAGTEAEVNLDRGSDSVVGMFLEQPSLGITYFFRNTNLSCAVI